MSKRSSAPGAAAGLVASTWPLATGELGARGREVAFVLLAGLAVVWSWQPLTTVIARSLSASEEYQHYSHIIVMPFITAYLLWLDRRTLVGRAKPGLRAAILPLAIGALTVWLAGTSLVTAHPEYRLSLAMVGLVVMWTSAFVLCYGARALWTALVPFLLLLFMIPLPPAALHGVIHFLQKGSADASEVLFMVIGMPAFRNDFTFVLPGLAIRVAEECSGIRSSLALVISGLVMAYLFLRSRWTRLVFVAVIVPLAILKNAVRIVALSWMAIHWDPSFITGSTVHRTGGIPVFLTSLMLLGGLAWLLRRFEPRSS